MVFREAEENLSGEVSGQHGVIVPKSETGVRRERLESCCIGRRHPVLVAEYYFPVCDEYERKSSIANLVE